MAQPLPAPDPSSAAAMPMQLAPTNGATCSASSLSVHGRPCPRLLPTSCCCHCSQLCRRQPLCTRGASGTDQSQLSSHRTQDRSVCDTCHRCGSLLTAHLALDNDTAAGCRHQIHRLHWRCLCSSHRPIIANQRTQGTERHVVSGCMKAAVAAAASSAEYAVDGVVF